MVSSTRWKLLQSEPVYVDDVYDETILINLLKLEFTNLKLIFSTNNDAMVVMARSLAAAMHNVIIVTWSYCTWTINEALSVVDRKTGETTIIFENLKYGI